MKNVVIYPELQPQQMDLFNQNAHANLPLAEGDSWFACADETLYESKRLGRDRVTARS